MRRPCLTALAVASLTLYLSGCNSSGISAASYNPGYGPFDQNGNYVEAWADKPAKKHWWSRKPKPTPDLPKPARPKKDPPLLASNTSPEPKTLWKRDSNKRAGPLASLNRSSQVSAPTRTAPAPSPIPVVEIRPTAPPRPIVAPRPVPAPTPVASAPPPPRPRPVQVKPTKPKPKPAPKPAAARHTVRKGDTLWSLSQRYGTSVGAIQRANGLRGNTIKLGQTLRIPR